MFSSIAIDIGAGSGRLIKGTFASGKLELEELYRFENEFEFIDGHYRWDVDRLLGSICEGLRIAAESAPSSIGIDTWGVDYVLLDETGDRIELPIAYRDSRTEGLMDEFFKLIPREEVYRRTGIQFMELNTLFQLFATTRQNPEVLERARTLLMIPDYLNYRLTGEKVNEFTIATTTQLLNVETQNWDASLIEALGISSDLFMDPVEPGTRIGPLRGGITEETGVDSIPVFAVASHDTGSAVAAVPAEGENWAYISTGTWCLMGVESDTPYTGVKAEGFNFTNEGGVNGSYRVLKNLMGLWLIRGIKQSFNNEYSYQQMIQCAVESSPFKHFIDASDSSFSNPDCMKKAFDEFCLRTGQEPPSSLGEYVRSALEGLAALFRQVLEELNELRESPIERIHLIGGGSRDVLLCQMAADATGLPVFAGPIEGTAIGNLIVQAMALGEFDTLDEARAVVRESFDIKEYTPEMTSAWDGAFETHRQMREEIP